jgi:hypothetical protein
MKEALILIFHLLTLVARLLGAGGGRAAIIIRPSTLLRFHAALK